MFIFSTQMKPIILCRNELPIILAKYLKDIKNAHNCNRRVAEMQS